MPRPLPTTPATGWTKTRSQLAHALRENPTADVTELRRQLKADVLAKHVREVVASAPVLTAKQRADIALLLTAGGDA